MEVFGRLVEEKVQPDHSVMEGMTVRPIDAEDLRATGSFLEIGDVMFGKLLAQVEADHVKLGCIAHVLFLYLSRYLLFKEPAWLASPSARLYAPACPKSGGQTQLLGPFPVQQKRFSTPQFLPISFSRRRPGYFFRYTFSPTFSSRF